MSGRITLEDIAQAADASLATVSLALRNKPGVSRAKREHILAIARSLGYERPVRAAEDAAAAVRNVALIFRTPDAGPERSSPALNRFYSFVLSGIQDAADDAQMNLLLGSIPVDARNNPRELPRRILATDVDGVLLVGAFREETVRRVIELLGTRAPAIVLVDNTGSSLALDSIGSMNRAGTAEATRYLIDRGHQRIAFAGRQAGRDPNFDDRYLGYCDAMAAAGLETGMIEITGEVVELPERQAGAFPFTSVVCGNDHAAWLLQRALQGRGIRVPDDVSIVGFDDTDHARDAVPAITTMAVDTLSMGRLAVRMLDFRLTAPEAARATLLLQPRLVERDSVRTIGNGA
jgi:LacI family transcriptional regulator